MKVIFVAPKAVLPKPLLNKLKKYAEIYFFEDSPIDIRNISMLKEKGDKILCPFPEPMAWKFPSEFIKEIPDLKAICLSTTAFHWIDGKLARSLGIKLTHVPNPPNGVAEAAIFAMLAVARRYPVTLKEKKFEYKQGNFLQEITHKTMGIVGLGRIGSRIAELGKRLGMNVIYWSRSKKNTEYKNVTLIQLFRTADYIFPALVLNEETNKFISKKLIDLMKPSSSIITTLNSEVVDVDHLLTRVKNKKLYGCALEDDKKVITDYDGNVFVTPHNNWYTKETIDKKMQIWVDSIISAIKGKPINVVN